INYTSDYHSVPRSFYKYIPVSSYTDNRNQDESYKITDVLFKSKVTEDHNWGNNGWVSMLTDSGHAQVKAGYGYELRLKVRYRTNALSNQPDQYLNGDESGQSVRPLNVAPNLSKDVYFETPDRQILSASGIYGTHSVFKADVTSFGKDHLDVEYTMKPVNTLGITAPGRVYVGENTPNGV
ncbi:hypothetical protein ACOTVE_09180, partial [Campylobacter jejuni]|uniref:hypothetical protein n=1 Tax=Campylobacter jejuni TaxID=197 RepID=UPI003B9E02FE